MSQRFTDAELAAEKWHKIYMWRLAHEMRHAFGSSELSDQREHEASTIERFAKLPHAHDQEPATIYAYDQQGRCVGTLGEPIRSEPLRIFDFEIRKED